METGDGSNISFWYDNWHPLGHLCMKFTEKLLNSLGLSVQATVKQWREGCRVQWPVGRRNTKEVQVFRQNTPSELFLHLEQKDCAKWLADPAGVFTVKSAMKKLRCNGQKVEWHKLVWGKGFIPRLAMILWLLCHKRLNTKDRLKEWGIRIEDETCVLCQEQEETIDHLFFCCSFTSRIWRKVQQLCLVHRGEHKWTEELHWLSHHWKGTSFSNQLKRLALAAVVYRIWQARNMKIHQGISIAASKIVQEIVEEVSTVTSAWKGVPLTKENWSMVIEWGISHECFRR